MTLNCNQVLAHDQLMAQKRDLMTFSTNGFCHAHRCLGSIASSKAEVCAAEVGVQAGQLAALDTRWTRQSSRGQNAGTSSLPHFCCNDQLSVTHIKLKCESIVIAGAVEQVWHKGCLLCCLQH